MEQLDTDDKLVEDSKNKKAKSSSSYVLIGVICLIAVCAMIFLFNYIKNVNSGGKIDGSKH